MRRLLLPLLVVVPLTGAATADAATCRAYGDGTHSLCTQRMDATTHATNDLGRCFAKRFFAIDASPVADASADGHFVGVQHIRMLNDIWSNHERYGPLRVDVRIRGGHLLRMHNSSRFFVVVHYTRVCG